MAGISNYFVRGKPNYFVRSYCLCRTCVWSIIKRVTGSVKWNLPKVGMEVQLVRLSEFLNPIIFRAMWGLGKNPKTKAPSIHRSWAMSKYLMRTDVVSWPSEDELPPLYFCFCLFFVRIRIFHHDGSLLERTNTIYCFFFVFTFAYVCFEIMNIWNSYIWTAEWRNKCKEDPRSY